MHLGMSGHVLITDAGGEPTEGGDWLGPRTGRAAERAALNPVWSRFTLTFSDGGSLRLFDQRRLGRVRLDPDLDALGPDAEQVGRASSSERLGRGRAPVKARLLDQSVVAGVGNLLADETLWQARLSPTPPGGRADRDRARRPCTGPCGGPPRPRSSTAAYTPARIIPFRRAGAHCPRCGTEMTRATVGGRTTWWCPKEQV